MKEALVAMHTLAQSLKDILLIPMSEATCFRLYFYRLVLELVVVDVLHSHNGQRPIRVVVVVHVPCCRAPGAFDISEFQGQCSFQEEPVLPVNFVALPWVTTCHLWSPCLITSSVPFASRPSRMPSRLPVVTCFASHAWSKSLMMLTCRLLCVSLKSTPAVLGTVGRFTLLHNDEQAAMASRCDILSEALTTK